mmetsp:Transcript_56489/g.93804  ORF Transcript_56489/g.93804 Transcript_56489/m.93804 type:complete len:131 (-) Transcript_56489:185-577(-)
MGDNAVRWWAVRLEVVQLFPSFASAHANSSSSNGSLATCCDAELLPFNAQAQTQRVYEMPLCWLGGATSNAFGPAQFAKVANSQTRLLLRWPTLWEHGGAGLVSSRAVITQPCFVFMRDGLKGHPTLNAC